MNNLGRHDIYLFLLEQLMLFVKVCRKAFALSYADKRR
jgi:uncharacterized protein YqjF (DUF2071 family)